MTSPITLNQHKVNNYVIIDSFMSEPIDTPDSRLLISHLPGLASRSHVESIGKPRDSTTVLEALPGSLVNLISKDTHLVFSLSWP